MKFTVTWKPQAKSQLSEIWLAASDRSAVTVAANMIDSLLKDTPLAQGESRAGNDRILIISPLAVVYEVQVEDRRVEVLAIRQLPGHARPE